MIIPRDTMTRRLCIRLIHQRGFGAIEAALVIVILGIVALFVMKGASLIPSMRAFVLAQQINQFQMAVSQYQADYRALPGDDPYGAKRWSRPDALFNTGNTVVSLSGDGKIDGLLDDSVNPLGEQYLAWSDLRYAGAIEGDATLVGQSARPETSSGGFFGFAAQNLGIAQALCISKVSGADALWLDKRLDDGVLATGKLRGTSEWNPGAGNQFSEPDTGDYNPEKTYIICVPALP